MKLNEIFQNVVTAGTLGTSYYRSSFGFPEDAEGREDSDVRELIYLPSHVMINPESQVSLIHNGKPVYNSTWAEMVQYLKDNWSNLSGTYRISQGRQVLHTFRIS